MVAGSPFGTLALVFALAAVLMLATAAAISLFSARKRGRCTLAVQATVAGVEKLSRSSTDIRSSTANYLPVYRSAAAGRTVTKRGFVAKKQEDIAVGSTVTLMVNPADPEDFYCPGKGVAVVRNVFLGVGVLLAVVTAAMAALSAMAG